MCDTGSLSELKHQQELNAMNALLSELEKGEASAKDGWIRLSDVENKLSCNK